MTTLPAAGPRPPALSSLAKIERQVLQSHITKRGGLRDGNARLAARVACRDRYHLQVSYARSDLRRANQRAWRLKNSNASTSFSVRNITSCSPVDNDQEARSN